MQLATIDFVNQKLEEIKALILEEDSYYINDVIITNLTDLELPELVVDLMQANDYTEDKMEEVLAIVHQIQDKAVTEEVE